MDFTQIFNADLWATFFQDWEQFAHGFLFSLLISIGGVDIMFMTKHWSAVHSNYIPPFLTAAILYFILCFPLATFARRWEAKNKEAY